MTAADTCPRCHECRAPLTASFWERVDKSGDCWLWTGMTNARGYGSWGVSIPKRGSLYAHRLTYAHAKGPIPEGHHIDHLCRNTSCVNPDHLEAVTPRENSLRGLRGRMVTECVNGHEYTPENTYWRTDDKYPRRQCRECRRARDRARGSSPKQRAERRAQRGAAA